MSRRCRPGLLTRGSESSAGESIDTGAGPCDCITPGLVPSEPPCEVLAIAGDDFLTLDELVAANKFGVPGESGWGGNALEIPVQYESLIWSTSEYKPSPIYAVNSGQGHAPKVYIDDVDPPAGSTYHIVRPPSTSWFAGSGFDNAIQIFMIGGYCPNAFGELTPWTSACSPGDTITLSIDAKYAGSPAPGETPGVRLHIQWFDEFLDGHDNAQVVHNISTSYATKQLVDVAPAGTVAFRLEVTPVLSDGAPLSDATETHRFGNWGYTIT